MNRSLVATSLIFFAGIAGTQQATTSGGEPRTPESLRSEIESLRTAKVAWRGIPWKSCLLEGLQESREQNKPLMLWVFIDRPVDDARC